MPPNYCHFATLSLCVLSLLSIPGSDCRPATGAKTHGAVDVSLLETIRAGRLPEGLDLPAFYQDPSRIGTLEQSAFSSPSPLVKQWLSTPPQEKVEILGFVIRDGNPAWIFAFLGEIAYSAITFEREPGMARLIVGAVQSTSVVHAQPALFLLDHLAQVCPHDDVRSHAAQNARDLRSRIGTLGY